MSKTAEPILRYHDPIEPANLQFSSKNLRFEDPVARKAYEPKTKDGKPTTELTDEQKKKQEAKGSQTIPVYSARNKNGAKVEGPPRCIIKNVALRVKLIQVKPDKVKLTLILSKKNAAHVEIIEMFNNYHDTFREACIATNGKYIMYAGDDEFDATIFKIKMKHILRTIKGSDEVTFTVAIPFYDNNNNVTSFYEKSYKKENEIKIDSFNQVTDIITPNSQIKLSFTFKEIWISADSGHSLVANTIILSKPAPKIVIRPENFPSVAESVYMEFYKRKTDNPKNISIGGNFYHMFNQDSIVNGKVVKNDENSDCPNTFYWCTYPFKQRWDCKGLPTPQIQKPSPQLTMDITPGASNIDCINPDVMNDGLSAIDDAYVEYFLKNKDKLLADFSEKEKKSIDDDWIRSAKRIVTLGKVKDPKYPQKHTVYLKMRTQAAKEPNMPKVITTKVYDYREHLEILASAGNPELTEKIQTLDPNYLNTQIPYELKKIDNVESLDVNEDTINEIIPRGTWVMTINKTERWGSWLDPSERKPNGGPHGNGLSTTVEAVFILKSDTVMERIKTTGFEDTIDDDGDNTPSFSTPFTIPSAKATIAELAAKQPKIAKVSVTKKESDEEEIVEKPKKLKKKQESDDEAEEIVEKPKKSSKKKQESDEDAEEIVEKPKKLKKKQESDEEEAPQPKKSSKKKQESDEEAEEIVEKPKKSSKKKQESDEDAEEIVEKPKKSSKKKQESDEEEAPQPKKSSKKKEKAAPEMSD